MFHCVESGHEDYVQIVYEAPIARMPGGKLMNDRLSLIAAALMMAQPVLATPAAKQEQQRQLSEIVFQNYPPRALAAGEQGAVFFLVTLDKDAQPTSCQVTHGSGHPLLDAETCNLIVQHAVFKSARDANGHVVRETAEGVVNWTIPGRAPVPVNPVLLTDNEKPEKQVCKKNLKMGTLSGYERVCMTPTEWARQGDEMKRRYDDMQGRKGSVCHIAVGGMGSGASLPDPPAGSDGC
jgi:protein TonB